MFGLNYFKVGSIDIARCLVAHVMFVVVESRHVHPTSRVHA